MFFAGLQKALNPLKVPELKQLCKEHGLDQYGTKAQLIKRLAAQGRPTGNNAGGSATPTKGTSQESVKSRRTDAAAITGVSASSPVPKVKSACSMEPLACSLSCMDPFNPVEPDGILRFQPVKSSKIKFQLDAPDLKQWRQQGQYIEMRMCDVTSKGENGQVKQVWPHEMRFVNNGNLVFEVIAPEAGHKRRDLPQRICQSLRPGANLVEITIKDDNVQSFAFAIVRTRPRTPQQLSQEVTTIATDAGQKRAKSLMGSISRGDGEVQCLGTDRTRLLCPITMVRPDMPARGKPCRHLQCFDLMAFLESNQQMKAINNRWSCPVCSLILKPTDLCVDLYIEDVLAKTGKHDVEVVFDKQGKWKVLPSACAVNTLDDDEVDGEIDLLASPMRQKRSSPGTQRDSSQTQASKKPRTSSKLADAVSNAVFPEALKARQETKRAIRAAASPQARKAEECLGLRDSPIAID